MEISIYRYVGKSRKKSCVLRRQNVEMQVENIKRLLYCRNTHKKGLSFWAKALPQEETEEIPILSKINGAYSWSCEAELSSGDDDSSIICQNDRIMHVRI